MIRAKVIGACGYGGVGITELLLRHPEAKPAALVDVEHVGQPIAAVYPHLAGFTDLTVIAPDDPAAKAAFDVVFMATPDGVGMKLAPAEVAAGARVIDYSGDFRFNSEPDYAEYARRIGRDPQHAAPALLADSVYGVAELHRDRLRASPRVVGNPGCFAVSCLLGFTPAVRDGLVDPKSLIADCKTGISGAGKKPAPTFHYPNRYEQMNAYKLGGHQHVCEVERELARLAGGPVALTFTPQVVPACRGIMSTLYGQLTRSATEADVLELYRRHYRNDPFVRVFDSAAAVGTIHVRGTNYCNLVVSVDARAGRLRVVSYIDNLMKGQAGSALQNMNLLLGLPETTGLDKPGQYP